MYVCPDKYILFYFQQFESRDDNISASSTHSPLQYVSLSKIVDQSQWDKARRLTELNDS